MTYHSQLVSILLYFGLNFFVTLTNKQILGSPDGSNLPRPHLLTALHAVSSFIGSHGIHLANKHLRHPRSFESPPQHDKKPLTRRQHLFLAAFSFFYTINIALSNASLALTNLSLHQTVRATAPVLAVAVSVVVLRKSLRTYSLATYLSLIPITLGAIIASSSAITTSKRGAFKIPPRSEYAGYHSEVSGILITLLGALTAVLKTIVTHKLMTSLSLNLTPVRLLQILSPYTILQAMLFAYSSNEITIRPSEMISTKPLGSRSKIRNFIRVFSILTSQPSNGPHHTHRGSVYLLWAANGIAAFCLNIASFEANKRCGPVSMAVAANLKQVALLALPGIATHIGMTMAVEEAINSAVVFGSLLTVVGGIWYARERVRDQSRMAEEQNKMVRYD